MTSATPAAGSGSAAPGNSALRAAAFQGQPAGFVSRALAAAVDGIAVLVIAVGLWGGVAAIRFIAHPARFVVPSPTATFSAVVYCLIATAYLTVAWALVGRTPGMQLLGLRVTRPSGEHVGALRSLARALLCVVFPIGLVWSAVSRGNRSLQDLVLGTSVIYDWGHHVVAAVPGVTGPGSADET